MKIKKKHQCFGIATRTTVNANTFYARGTQRFQRWYDNKSKLHQIHESWNKKKLKKKKENCTSVSSSVFFLLLLFDLLAKLIDDYFVVVFFIRFSVAKNSVTILSIHFALCLFQKLLHSPSFFFSLSFALSLTRHFGDQCVMTCDDHEMATTFATL